jgi:hypothetical protein
MGINLKNKQKVSWRYESSGRVIDYKYKTLSSNSSSAKKPPQMYKEYICIFVYAYVYIIANIHREIILNFKKE